MSAQDWQATPTMYGRAFDIGAADGANIALVHGPNEGGPDDFAANARLIAAAPDLLHALKRLAVWHDAASEEDLAIAACAIAKAEGRKIGSPFSDQREEA